MDFQICFLWLKHRAANTDDSVRVGLTRGARAADLGSPMIELPYNVNRRFELLELLGSGDFSEVFLARDLEPGKGPRTVALKLFRDLGRDRGLEQTLSSFEFQILSRLRHPNLATVYDYGVDAGSGRAWFTMELLDGVDFLEAVEHLPPLEILPLVVSACRALHHIHTRGLIHHDLKPGNLIVIRAGANGRPLPHPRVKLTDFGLSTPLDQADDGHLRGTVEFMAPEMLAGRGKNHLCDLYSLGVLLYLCLSGRHPWPGGRRPGTESQSPPPLRGRNDEPLPSFLEDLVGRLLQADPAKRHQSANEVIRDLGLYTGTPYAPEPGSVGATSASADTVLTVDQEQLDGLHRRLLRLGAGEPGPCRPALIIGRPGSGRSHLVMEVRRLAQTSGAAFFFFPAPDETLPEREMAGEIEGLVRQIRQAVRHQGSGLVAVIDVEEFGAAVLSALIRRLGSAGEMERIFLLALAPPDHPATIHLQRNHPNEAELEQITLRPLDRPRMAVFLSQLLGNPVGPEAPLTACVLEESDGIPRLAEETVTHLRATGSLTLEPAGWCFDPLQHLMDLTPPGSHLLAHHQQAVEAGRNRTVEALALFGGPATVQMVAELLGSNSPAETEVAASLTKAAGHLLAVDTGAGTGVHRFRSLLARNLMRHGPDRGWRRKTHDRAARALQQGLPAPGVDPPGALTWWHLLHAGRIGDAWAEGLAQGTRLEASLLPGEAGRIYEALRRAGRLDDVPPDLAADTAIRAAGLLRAAGRTEEAWDWLELGLNAARQAGGDDRLADIRLAMGYLLERRGDLDKARGFFTKALRELPPPESERHARLHLQLGLNALWSGMEEEAGRHLGACCSAYQACGHPEGDESSLFLEASIAARIDGPEKACDLLRSRLAGGGRKGDTVMTGRLLVLRGELSYHLNRFEETERCFQEGMEIFKRWGERTLEITTLANLGALHFERGHFSTTSRYNLDCLRAHERVGNRHGQALCRYNLGVCDFHRGRYTEALQHLGAAGGIFETIGNPQGLAQSLNMEAELYLSLGLLGRTDERLQGSAAVLAQDDTGYNAADRLLLEAELALRTTQPEVAEDLCGRARSLFTGLGDRRQLARTDLLDSRCQAALAMNADAAESLARARTAIDETDMPRLRAELLLAGSALRAATGLGPTDKQCVEQARQLLENLAEVEDPDLRISMLTILGAHLDTTGRNDEAMDAYRQAFQILRDVAGRFTPEQSEWKSSYLSTGCRARVVRTVSEWSREKKSPDNSSNP